MPTDWPSPPLMEHYLLESPWGVAAMLAAVAAMLFLAGGRAGRRRWQVAAVAPVLLAAAVVLTAHLVTTEREAMVEATESLVRAAVSPFDIDVVERLTDERFTMTVTDGTRIVEGRDALLDAVRRAERVVTIKSASISNRLAVSDGPGEGRVYIALFSEAVGRMGGGLGKTQWVFHWGSAADGSWRLTKAEFREFDGRDVPPTLLPR